MAVADLYVKATGSDSTGTGALGSPYATIAKAWSVISGAQRVIGVIGNVGTAGTDLVLDGKTGSSGNPYIICGADIGGTLLTTPIGPTRPNWMPVVLGKIRVGAAVNTTYLTLRQLETNLAITPAGPGLLPLDCDHLEIDQCVVTNHNQAVGTTDNSIGINAGFSGTPSNLWIHHSWLVDIGDMSNDTVQVEPSGWFSHAIYLESVSNPLVEHCVIKHVSGRGLQLFGGSGVSGGIYRYCLFDDCGMAVIVDSNAVNNTWTRNLFVHTRNYEVIQQGSSYSGSGNVRDQNAYFSNTHGNGTFLPDANAVNVPANPFTDYAGGDLSVKLGSAAMGYGPDFLQPGDIAPPAYQSPNTTGWTVVNLGAPAAPFNWTTDSQTVRCADNTNYVLVAPHRLHLGTIDIHPGRNSKILIRGLYKSIGLTGASNPRGAGQDPSPGVSTTQQDSGAYNIRVFDAAGAVIYLEGLHIDGGAGPTSPLWGYPVEQDGLRTSCPNVVIWMKNCRIENLIGGINPPHKHADVVQTDGGVKELHMEDCYGASHYNNLYLRRENSPVVAPCYNFFANRVEMAGYSSNPSSAPTGTNTTAGGTPKTLRSLSLGTQPSDNPCGADDTLDCGGPGNNNSRTNARNPTRTWLAEFYGTPPVSVGLDDFMHPPSFGYVPARSFLDTSTTPDSAYWPDWQDTTSPPNAETTPSTDTTIGSGDAGVYGIINLGPPAQNFAPANRVGLHFTGTFNVESAAAAFTIRDRATSISDAPTGSLITTGAHTTRTIVDTGATITDHVTVTLPTPPPPPPPPQPTPPRRIPGIGCSDYQIVVYPRGIGTTPVGTFTYPGWTSLSWEWRLNEKSAAVLTIADIAGKGDECLGLFGRVRRWQHELVIIRAQDGRIYSGPIYLRNQQSGSGLINAYDLSLWLDRRDLLKRHAMKGDLSDVYAELWHDAIDRENSMKYNLIVDGKTGLSLDAPQPVAPSDHGMANTELQALIDAGLNAVTIDRTTRIGPPSGVLLKRQLTDTHVAFLPDVSDDGTEQANRYGVLAQQNTGGNQVAPYAEASRRDLIRRDGELVTIEQSSTATTSQDAQKLADQREAVYADPQAIVATITLSQDAPFPIPSLIPGRLIDTRIYQSPIPITGRYRITRLGGTVDGNSGEQVTIDLIAAPDAIVTGQV